MCSVRVNSFCSTNTRYLLQSTSASLRYYYVLVEQKLLTLTEHISFPQVLLCVSGAETVNSYRAHQLPSGIIVC
jgi:hypothetical protein